MDNELEEIRRRRLAQMQEQQASAQVNPEQAAYQQEQAQAEMEARKQELLRKNLNSGSSRTLNNASHVQTRIGRTIGNAIVFTGAKRSASEYD